MSLPRRRKAIKKVAQVVAGIAIVFVFVIIVFIGVGIGIGLMSVVKVDNETLSMIIPLIPILIVCTAGGLLMSWMFKKIGIEMDISGGGE